jgi:hypothetical protein
MDNRYRFVVSFLLVLNTLLTALLCGLIRDTRQDVNALREVLATKQDLVNVAVPKLTLFHEEKCTGCHTERRFAGPHKVRGGIEHAVAQMNRLPDVRIAKKELDKVHASLDLLGCSQCHGADQLRRLVLKSPAERKQIVREMVAKPNSNITPDEATKILRSFEQLVGF